MDTFHGPYFHFCLELALETWVKALLIHSLWIHDLGHTHSLASDQQSGPSDQRTLLWTKGCLNCQKWSPYKVKERFLHPFVHESRQMAHPSQTKAFLQAAATAIMRCQAERWTHPPPPVPSFLLAQNLSSKRIASTYNMRPKSDAKKHHRLLKG